MGNRLEDVEILDALARGHGGSPFTSKRNLELLERVPEGLRLLHYSRAAIPDEYLASFGYYHNKIGNFHLDRLPDVMQREMMFVVWQIVDLGGRVPCAPLGLLTRELAETVDRLTAHRSPVLSLLDRTPAQWRTDLKATWVQRTGSFPNPETFRTFVSPLDRACKLLWFAYDQHRWWEREIWDPSLDARIPRRAHEPFGTTAIHWHRIEPPWLRSVAMWQIKTLLETDHLTWTTAHTRFHGLMVFSRFAVEHSLTSPLLANDPAEVRPIMLEFLAKVTAHRTPTGTRRVQSSVASIAAAVRTLYAFAHDHRDEAVRQTRDTRWSQLGPEYLRFWRPDDMPRKKRVRYDERHLFSERVLDQIVQHAHKLAEPRADGGLADPQALRLLLLIIATGRRVSELLMLDPNPIIPVPTDHIDSADTSSDGLGIAKLRYQQTKIDGAPDTIFVDREVVEIIAEQQRWLADYLRINGCQEPPRYLFVKKQNNARGQHHYTAGRLRQQLEKLVRLAGLTDEDGGPLRLTMLHRFRHTKATSLLNAGVPLHVVQRYIGHTSPEMTMHYAQTLESTAKAEFLRFHKINSSGRPASLPADELYELMALDARTDRVLPNGWCTLPPARSCDKGNACLTCDLFVTDRRFLQVHQNELFDLRQLVEKRQQAHTQRTGQPMSDNHVWLTQRHREQEALRSIIDSLESAENSRGAGAASRIAKDQQGDALAPQPTPAVQGTGGL